jgi:hypothetical protein
MIESCHHLAEELRGYPLPRGVLPLAPSRQPLRAYSLAALAKAAEFSMANGCKRGLMSHAVRTIAELPFDPVDDTSMTIEAHLDGRSIPQPIADALVELGFELDGFARFVPQHFTDHFTYKFKLPASDETRRIEYLSLVRAACTAALALLQEADLEAYIELEMYAGTNRRYWTPAACTTKSLARFPLAERALRTVLPACNAEEALARGVSIEFAKHADIHVKVAKDAEHGTDELLIGRLCAAGFYRVLTWAGNDICTAQFQSGRDAMRVFDVLDSFFSEHCGASEMTLESAPALWRTRTKDGRQLAAVPPLVLSVDLSSGAPAKIRETATV